MTIEYKDSKRIVVLSTDVANTPTTTNDFSTTTTESKSGSAISIHGGVLGGNYKPTGSSECSTVDPLGTTLSNTSWIARFKVIINGISNPSTETNAASIGFFANNGAFGSGNEDSIVMAFWNNSSGSKQIRLAYTNNSFPASLTDYVLFTKQMAEETLYVELIRISDTSCKANLYSDSNYSSLIESQTLAISAGTCTNLRYFGGKNWNRAALTGNHDIDVDDLKVYDGISSTTNKPTNVQDNSLLVEKDIGNRFWSSEATTPTFEDDFSGTDDWTDTSTNPAVSTTNDRLDFDADGTGIDQVSYIDLGTTVTGNYVIRFKTTLTTVTTNTDGTPQTVLIGLSDDTSLESADTQDFVGLRIRTRNSGNTYDVMAKNGSLAGSTDQDSTFTRTPTTETVYTEIIDNGSTITINQYSDEYSTLYESQTGSFDLTGGQYLKVMIEEGDGTGNGRLTGYIDNITFYNGVTSVTPATWTNEDIFTDDYSSDSGWTSVGSNTTVNSTVAGKVYMTGDIDNWVYKDLGFNLKSKWIARGNIKAISYGTTGRSLVPVTFIDDPTVHVKNGTGNNGIGIFMDTTGGTRYFWLSIITNGSYDRGTNDSNHRISFVVDTVYYYELIRDGSTLTLRITTNSDFSGGSVITRTTTLPSNTFRYLVHGTDVATSGSNTVEADDTVVHNGVTSIN